MSFAHSGKTKFTQCETRHDTITMPASEGKTEFTQLLTYCSLLLFHFPFQNYCVVQASSVCNGKSADESAKPPLPSILIHHLIS